jgi:hypothetical protein
MVDVIVKRGIMIILTMSVLFVIDLAEHVRDLRKMIAFHVINQLICDTLVQDNVYVT